MLSLAVIPLPNFDFIAIFKKSTPIGRLSSSIYDEFYNMKAVLFFDGASLGNPGRRAIGVVLKTPKKTYKFKKEIGKGTNNQAEYYALIAGMMLAKKLGVKELTVKGDSQLVIKQMVGEYKVHDEKLKKLYEKAKELEKSFRKVSYEWIPREKNKEADKLAEEALKGN